MKLAKIIAVGLSAVMLTTGFSVSALAAQTTESTVSTPGFKTYDALYAHAVLNSEDTQAWLRWQSVHDENFNEIDSNKSISSCLLRQTEKKLIFTTLIHHRLQ